MSMTRPTWQGPSHFCETPCIPLQTTNPRPPRQKKSGSRLDRKRHQRQPEMSERSFKSARRKNADANERFWKNALPTETADARQRVGIASPFITPRCDREI
jgi:hypothetical protein